MIELRWVPGAIKGDASTEGSFRLQYRQQCYRYPDGKTLGENYGGPDWSEWTDVPTVKDER